MPEQPKLYERIRSVQSIISIVLVLLAIAVAIGLLCSINTTSSKTHMEDYTNCIDTLVNLQCKNFTYASTYTVCICDLIIQVKEDIRGDVTLYYEIDFDQTNSTYANSRDNDQLMGHPGDTPAASCGAYRFDQENRTIFPCGEVADSIFNDTFSELQTENSENLPVSYTGLLVGNTATSYHNPSEEDLKKFVKPKSWPADKRVWEYTSNVTGVENEFFRGWMDTSLKRKPVWRLLPTGNFTDGLPAGNYTMRIQIYYPVERYNGSKRIILEGVYPVQRVSFIVFGAIFMIIGLSLPVAYFAVLYFRSKTNGSPTRFSALPDSKTGETVTIQANTVGEGAPSGQRHTMEDDDFL